MNVRILCFINHSWPSGLHFILFQGSYSLSLSLLFSLSNGGENILNWLMYVSHHRRFRIFRLLRLCLLDRWLLDEERWLVFLKSRGDPWRHFELLCGWARSQWWDWLGCIQIVYAFFSVSFSSSCIWWEPFFWALKGFVGFVSLKLISWPLLLVVRVLDSGLIILRYFTVPNWWFRDLHAYSETLFWKQRVFHGLKPWRVNAEIWIHAFS